MTCDFPEPEFYKEHWVLLVDGDTVLIQVFQGQELPDGSCKAWVTTDEIPVTDLRIIVQALPHNHRIDCVTFLFPIDYEDTGALDLYMWFRKQGRTKGFPVTSASGTADLEQVKLSMKTYLPEGAEWVG
jgi:hypothetical protein